ncbi:MAG: hypothetical protein ACREKE_02260 [bacterium]
MGLPVPNPNPADLALGLAGSADSIRLRLHSKAQVLVADFSVGGPFGSGWDRVSLPEGWSRGLANGPHFAVVWPMRAGLAGAALKPLKMVILR